MAADGLKAGSSTEEVLSAFSADERTLANRTVIMTGATAGIGKATASALAGTGCTLVCGCRNPEKGRALVLSIEEDLQQQQPSVFVPHLELSDLNSVRAFVADVGPRLAAGEWPPLYALVLNAGLINLDGAFTSEDGMEDTFRTNHLAHFLLTQLMLPYLRAAAPSRVVVVVAISIKIDEFCIKMTLLMEISRGLRRTSVRWRQTTATWTT